MVIGEGEKISSGDDLAILSIGHPGNFVIEAQKTFKVDGVSIAHYNMRFVKPLDENLLHKICKKFDKIITVEDGCIQGGFGSSILEFMAKNNYKLTVKMLGIPDKFISHGSQQELYEECFYDKEAIIKSTYNMLKSKTVSQSI